MLGNRLDQIVALRTLVRHRVLFVFVLHTGDAAMQLTAVGKVIFGVDPILTGRPNHRKLWPQTNGIDGTSFLAIAAENATQDVDLKTYRELFDFVGRMFARFDMNTLRRTGRGTEKTRRTSHLTIGATSQEVFPFEAIAVGRRLLRPLQGIGLLTSGNLGDEDLPSLPHTFHDGLEISHGHLKEVAIIWGTCYFDYTHD